METSVTEKSYLSSPGHQYLAGRGLTKETMETFSLMYFNGTKLYGPASALASTWIENVKSIFNTVINGEYLYRRRFSDCIVIPIFDVYNKFVSIAVRHLQNVQPKFDSFPYVKGQVLFGLNVTHPAILLKDELFVTEGFFDFMVLYQSGIKNAVASNGVTLSPHQMQLCSRFSNNFNIILDPDKAGVVGSMKMKNLIHKWSGTCKTIQLDENMDLDDYLLKFGAQRLLDYVKNTGTFENNTSFTGNRQT